MQQLWDLIVSTVKNILKTLAPNGPLGRELALQPPQFLFETLTTIQRTALMALLLFTVLVAAALFVKLIRRDWKHIAAFCVTLVLAAALSAWALWPTPLVQAADVLQARVQINVAGKSEVVRTLNRAQTQTLLETLAARRCMRTISAALPYTGDEETVLLFTLETQQGEIHVLATPHTARRYTMVDTDFICVVTGDTAKLYETLSDIL